MIDSVAAPDLQRLVGAVELTAALLGLEWTVGVGLVLLAALRDARLGRRGTLDVLGRATPLHWVAAPLLVPGSVAGALLLPRRGGLAAPRSTAEAVSRAVRAEFDAL